MLRRLVLLLCVSCFALGTLTTPTANGAVITWGTPFDITGDSDVSTDGALVLAVNLAGPNATVNGVFFQAFQPGSTFNTGAASAPFVNLSSSYQSLLSGADAAISSLGLQFSGLTVGLDYEVQWWVSNSALANAADITVSAGDTVVLDPNTSNSVGGLGQYVFGNFTANAPTQTVNFSSSVLVVVNAVQLRRVDAVAAVPEPASIVVWLAMSGGALFVRGRSRRA